MFHVEQFIYFTAIITVDVANIDRMAFDYIFELLLLSNTDSKCQPRRHFT